MMSVDLEIAERLHKGQPYNVIAKELKKSPKTISKVSRLVNSGSIKIDKEGKAHFVEDAELRLLERTDEYMPLVYDIMRALGAESPKAGLQQAHRFIAKVNPYLLYYKVKTPADLITLFEAKIKELNNELNAYRNEDAFSLAKRLGITEETVRNYKRVLEFFEGKWKGTLVDFLNEAAEYSQLKLRESVGGRKRVVEEYTL